MDGENSNLQIRIAIASILATVGCALISRLPQLLPGQVEIPWYQSGFFWPGIALVAIALLILIITPARWQCFWYRLIGLPREIHRACVWKLHGPKYCIYKPVVSQQATGTGSDYSATMKIFVKNRDNYPLRINFSSIKMKLMQPSGRTLLWCSLTLSRAASASQDEIPPHGEKTCQVSLDGQINSNAYPIVNSKDGYRWGVQGILVTLSEMGSRELHTGIYDKYRSQPSFRGIL
jgi:hypothetical protein